MKTTSLELSKQLKEAGAKQESEKVWARFKTKDSPFVVDRQWAEERKGVEIICASFDCHELLERLSTAKDEEAGWELTVCLVRDRGIDSWVASIEETANAFFDPKSPAEALGKLKLWCLVNGHCEKAGGVS